MAGKRTDRHGRHRSRGAPEDWLSKVIDHRMEWPKGYVLDPKQWPKDYVPPPWLTLVDVLSKDGANELIENIARCLGRKPGDITDRERLTVAETLWHWRGLRTTSQRLHSFSRQDVLRTLRGIAREKDDLTVLASYRQCDANTRTEVQESLRKASEERLPASAAGLSQDAINAFKQSRFRIFRSLEKEPEALRQAAGSAADRMSASPEKGGQPPREYQRGFAKACLVLWEKMGGASDAAIWLFECSNPEPSPLLRFAGLLFNALEVNDAFDLAKVKLLLTEARYQGKVSPPS